MDYGCLPNLGRHYKSLKKIVKKRMFSDVFYKPLSGNALYGRFLLAKAMKAAQPPNNLRRVDADDPSGGETILDDLQRLLIPIATESGYDHRFIGDIEVGVRGGKTLILID